MARSLYKFLFFSLEDLYIYYSKIINKNLIVAKPSRQRTVNGLNINRKYKIYQGKYWHSILVNKWAIGWKIGAFSKTRKPFFFRSKKKKR